MTITQRPLFFSGLVTNRGDVTRDQKLAAVEDEIRNFEAYSHRKLTPEIEASLRKWVEASAQLRD